MGYVIDVLPAADIDQLEALWRELLSHHLRDAPQLAALGTARAPEDSWRVRRRRYLQWLAAPRATVLAAQSPGPYAGVSKPAAYNTVWTGCSQSTRPAGHPA